MHRHRHDAARFVGIGVRLVPAEVAAEAGRRDGGDVPVAEPRELLRQPAVQLDAVRVRDRQQTAACGHAWILTTVLPQSAPIAIMFPSAAGTPARCGRCAATGATSPTTPDGGC